MKIKMFFSFLILFGIFWLGQSCSKKGDPGKDGLPGNAVNVSDSFQLGSTDYTDGYWSVSTGPGSSMGITAKVATRDIPKLTTKVLNSGTVLVYMKVPNALGSTAMQYTLLPFSIRSFSVGYLTRISFAFEAGKIRIYYYYEQTDAAGSPAPNITTTTVPTYMFRYVIIPGTDGFRSANPPVDYSDYEAVMKYYYPGK